MSDFKRRDIINYFNNNHIEQQKKLYSVENFSNKKLEDFFNFAKNYDLEKNIDREINISIGKYFNTTNEHCLWRENIYCAIELIFKAFLEVYESVLIADDVSSYYERSALVYKAKSAKTLVNFSSADSIDVLLETIRNKNAKIVVLSTQYQQNAIKNEYITKVLENSPALVVIDDYSNFLTDIDFLNKYENVILLKSIDTGFAKATVLFSSNDVNREMKYLTNFSDINILSKLQLLNSIKIDSIEVDQKVSSDIAEKLEKFASSYTENKKEHKSVEKVKIKNEVQPEEKAEEPKTKEDKALEQTDATENNIDKEKETEDNKNNLAKEKTTEEVKKNSTAKEVVEEEEPVYEPVLIPENRQSLINELTKFSFVSIFSSNQIHVYILSKVPIHSRLLENGILLKKYNSSNGEILRLTIDHTTQNKKILKTINEVSKRKNVILDFHLN